MKALGFEYTPRATLGLVGGIVGASLGTIVVVGVSAAKS